MAVLAADLESSVVDLGVVSRTHWDEVVEVGWAAVFPVVDVVDVAPFEGPVTAGHCAVVLVAGGEGEALLVVGEAGFAAHVQHDAV